MKRLLAVLLGTLGLIVLGFALTWAPDRSVEQLEARWAPPPSQFMELQGLRVHFRDQGPRSDPLPVVLLHGTSASLHTWEGWVDGLNAQHRVLTVDLPGFGLTGPAPDGDYTMPAYTRFVLGFLDRLHVQNFVLGGNSLGGEIAWHVAAAAPERVKRLILVDAAGYPLSAKSIPLGFALAAIPQLDWLTAHSLPRVIVWDSLRNVYGDPSRITPALIDRYYELLLREGNRKALSQRLRQLNSGQDVAQIQTLRMPTLILWGAKDRLIPLGDARAFQRDIQGSRLVVFPGLGHVPQEEDPRRTGAEVVAFLAQ